jgi:hypothetical protein
MQMIRYGLLAGFSFLLAVLVMDRTAPVPSRPGTGEADISEQVWQVLAEARRILEESA